MKRNIASEIYEKPDINVVDIEMDGLILSTSGEYSDDNSGSAEVETDNPNGAVWD